MGDVTGVGSRYSWTVWVALVPLLAIWGLGRAECHAAPPQPFNWVCLGISWSLDLQEVRERRMVFQVAAAARGKED